MDRKPTIDTMELIYEYVNWVKEKYSPEKILLFGSRARGDHLKESDVDILVISKKFEGVEFMKRMQELYNWNKSVNLDSIGLTPEEFRKRKDELSIIGSAAREGIEI